MLHCFVLCSVFKTKQKKNENLLVVVLIFVFLQPYLLNEEKVNGSSVSWQFWRERWLTTHHSNLPLKRSFEAKIRQFYVWIVFHVFQSQKSYEHSLFQSDCDLQKMCSYSKPSSKYQRVHASLLWLVHAALCSVIHKCRLVVVMHTHTHIHTKQAVLIFAVLKAVAEPWPSKTTPEIMIWCL